MRTYEIVKAELDAAEVAMNAASERDDAVLANLESTPADIEASGKAYAVASDLWVKLGDELFEFAEKTISDYTVARIMPFKEMLYAPVKKDDIVKDLPDPVQFDESTEASMSAYIGLIDKMTQPKMRPPIGRDTAIQMGIRLAFPKPK